MHVTDGLAQLAEKIAVRSVQQEVEAEQREIRAVLKDVRGDPDQFVAREASAQLLKDYRAVSDPQTIRQTIRARSHELTYRLFGKKVELSPPPMPPERVDVWDLVVIKGDRANFDKHMDACVKQSLNAVRFGIPGAELAQVEDMRDPHMQGLWCLFEKGHQAAKQAQIYTCGGPRLSGGMVLDVRSAEQKLRDERWEKATKK